MYGTKELRAVQRQYEQNKKRSNFQECTKDKIVYYGRVLYFSEPHPRGPVHCCDVILGQPNLLRCHRLSGLLQVAICGPCASELSYVWGLIPAFMHLPSLHPHIKDRFERMKQRPYKCLKSRNSIKSPNPSACKSFLIFFFTSKEDESNKSPFKTTGVKMKLCVFHILQNRQRDENEGEFPIVKHAQKQQTLTQP